MRRLGCQAVRGLFLKIKVPSLEPREVRGDYEKMTGCSFSALHRLCFGLERLTYRAMSKRFRG